MQGALRKLSFTSKHLFKPSLSFCPAKRFSYTQDTTGLNEEQAQIYQTALDFAKENLAPYAAEWDKKEYFPIETMRKAAELGFGAIYASPEYGGCGMGRLEASLIFEALATGDVSVTGFMTVHNMCTWLIDEFGTEEQKKRWMPSLVTMEKLISICLTEPNSGSDSAAMQTFAREEGDYFILNGSKSFISGATASDLYTVFCKTGSNERSCLIVEKGTPGFTFGKIEQKLGWRNQPTAMLLFEDCKVPKANLLGVKGTGFKKAMVGLEGGRINIASCSLGGASFCLETAQEYVKSRKQFGKPLADFQNIQFKLADMATDLVASRLMVRTAAKMIDENHPDKSMYSAMAKKFATDKCSDIVNYALQMHGGYGYLMDYPIERCLRDLRVHQILEGTNEVMQLIVSRRLLKD